ncbi:hypothetical protein V8E53_005693 [Lactarius tabidus]
MTATSRPPPPHHGRVDCACSCRAVTACLRLPAYRRLVLSCVLSRRRDAILFTCHPPLPARRSCLLLPGPGEKGDIDSGVTRHLCPLPHRLFTLSSPQTCRLCMLSSCSHHTSAAACVPTARVVTRPLPPAQHHPLHMPPTPTSTTQLSAAPWPWRERGRRQRGHPPSMSPSSPPVCPLLTTDVQTGHAVVVQSPHVCGCLRADGSRCCALLCILSSRCNATLLTITCHPPLPAQRNHLLFPGPGEKGDVDSGGHLPSMSPSLPPVRPLQNPHTALSRQCDAALCSGGGHCPLRHPCTALS